MTGTAEPRQAPAGWYPDPLVRRHVRHWDGAAWSEHSQRRWPWDFPWFIPLVTVAAAIPLAVAGGIVAAHAAKPAPPETFGAANGSDADAKALLADLGAGIESFYAVAEPNTQVPVILETDTGYTYSRSGALLVDWVPPSVTGRDGVEFVSQRGDSALNWCVSVTAPAGEVKDWKITPEGIEAGLCF